MAKTSFFPAAMSPTIRAIVDWTGAEVGRFFRPVKRPVTMRLDDDVIEWLKSYGRGYQTKANLLLRHAMEASRQAMAKGRGAVDR